MKNIVYACNNRNGYLVLKELKKQNVNIEYLILHPKEDLKYYDEIKSEANLEKEKIFFWGKNCKDYIIEKLKDKKSSILFSVNFAYKIPKEILCLFQLPINLHTSYLPYNKGANPNVWSIIDKTPAGVSIHKMTDNIDGGEILFQEEIEVNSYDTGKTVYEKLENASIKLIREKTNSLFDNSYELINNSGGKTHYKKNFKEICKIDLDKVYKAGDFIDILRALTYPPYKNAYFIDRYENKIYVEINLTKDDENDYKLIFLKDIRGECPKAYSTRGVNKWDEFIKSKIDGSYKDKINNIFENKLNKNKYSFKINMKIFFAENNFRKSDLDNVAKEFLDIIFQSKKNSGNDKITGLLLDFDDKTVDEINLKRVLVDSEEDQGIYFEIYYKLRD